MTDLPSGGTPRPITRWGEPALHAPCRLIESFDETLAELAADMVATMHAADGVGLAANQVGIDLAVFVFDCVDENEARHRGVVCNPKLTVPQGRDRILSEADEGCLSLPGAFVPYARPDTAAVAGFDWTGEPVSYSGDGTLARCLQHEIDHLGGTVLGDRLSARLRKRLHKQAALAAEQFPPGWPASGVHAG